MVKVPDLLLRGPVPYKLYVHPGVWPWQALPLALADEPLCFLLPLLGSMQEHTVEDDRVVGPLDTPSGVFIEELFGIKPMLHLSKKTALPPSPTPWLTGTCAIHLHNATQVISGSWSNNKNITLPMTDCAINIKHQQLTFSFTQNQVNHKVQLYTLFTLQQPTKTHHPLVRASPDTLLT